MTWRVLMCGLCFAALSNIASGAIIVNAPQPITRQVTVQLFQTALDDGTSPATAFGDAAQRADIEAGIDAIWAQAGIDINILPTITSYASTFAYQGTAGSNARPQSDLNTIISNAKAAGVVSPDPLVIDLFLVNVAPSFTPLTSNTTAGFALIDDNGIAGYIGSSLLTFDNGRDIISSMLAHEMGHNLGLDHTASGITNLMSPAGISQQLISGQISTARSSSFARLLEVPEPNSLFLATVVGSAISRFVGKWQRRYNR